jgi:NAD-dependent dihydropyrimidine dehydrogenase PreA subunit
MADVRQYKGSGSGVVITIDHDKCEGHGACVDVCPAEVYVLTDGKVAAANVEDCIQCAACQGECPVDAILSHTAWWAVRGPHPELESRRST